MSEQAKRCWLGFHQWTKWEMRRYEADVTRPFSSKQIPVTITEQKRVCLRCGKTQIEEL